MSQPNFEKSEEELWAEALRATCSHCVMAGYCCCGELEEEDHNISYEDEEDYLDDEDDLGVDDYEAGLWELKNFYENRTETQGQKDDDLPF